MSIYLDNAATTRVAPEVLEAMLPYFSESYGNAGSIHHAGRKAASAVDLARKQVASFMGTTPEHIIFTSGGSESNNMVFKGLRDSLLESGKTHIIVSAIEHDSVLRAAESLTKDGFDITYVQPDATGVISPKLIEEALRANTGLVSVMYANNEMGAVNDISEIGGICKKHSVFFHTDCVQAAGQYPIEVDNMGIDFASVSGHKIHAPKGVGALYVRDTKLAPLICGGAEQEYGLRGGTENVPGIVGLGVACDIISGSMKEDVTQMSTLKQRFYMTLCEELRERGEDAGIVHINGMSVIHPGKLLNMTVDGVDGETLLLMLDANGVCVSAGSACRNHEAEPSHVLMAMGLDKEAARNSVRISFSKFNNTDEVAQAARIFAFCISALRNHETE